MAAYQVLVVDDQLDVRQMLRSGLESLGSVVKVTDIPSGEEAILVSSRQHFDLLVADVRLAGMSGLELMQKARQRNSDLKVILITGLTDPEVRRLVAGAGADAYFYKPIETNDFLQVVENILGLDGVDRQTPQESSEKAPIETIAKEWNLPDFLTSLRHQFQALAVILLDDEGLVVERAGELDNDEIEAALFPVAMTVLGASSRAAHILGKIPPDDVSCVAGQHYELFLAHAGMSNALIVLTETVIDLPRRMSLVKQIRPAANELAILLELIDDSGLVEPVEQQIAEPAVGKDLGEDSAELDELLEQAAKIELSTDDVDEFWDAAVVQEEGDKASQGTSFWEKARRLGRRPEGD